MGLIKKIILAFLNFWNKLFYPKFTSPKVSIVATFMAIFPQKILGINRKVPWPVHFTSVVKGEKNILPGSRTPGLAMGCFIDGRNGIEIGENTWIGPRVSIISMNHDINNFNSYSKTDSIKIGKNCWIAANSVILPGVQLGNHIVVAAGSVVTKSFDEDNIIIGGVPAAIIKKIDEYRD